MTEKIEWADNPEQLHKPLSKEELLIIGGEVLLAMQRTDLQDVSKEHIEKTGKTNPNSVSPGMFIGKPDISITTEDDKAYRSIDRRAIKDLAETGVVRGAYTATEGERANTKSNTTYWSAGSAGKEHGFASPGHLIVETPLDNPQSGWVTADKQSAIYARDHEGDVHNILKP